VPSYNVGGFTKFDLYQNSSCGEDTSAEPIGATS